MDVEEHLVQFGFIQVFAEYTITGVSIYVPDFGNSINLYLRRTLVLPVILLGYDSVHSMPPWHLIRRKRKIS
jgi:hypothetical protein